MTLIPKTLNKVDQTEISLRNSPEELRCGRDTQSLDLQSTGHENASDGSLLDESHPQRSQDPYRKQQDENIGEDVERGACEKPRVDVEAGPRAATPVRLNRRAEVEEAEGSRERVSDGNGHDHVDDGSQNARRGEAEIEGENGRLDEERGDIIGDGARRGELPSQLG